MKAPPAEDLPEDDDSPLRPSDEPGKGAAGRGPGRPAKGRAGRISRSERSKINRANRTTHGLAHHDLYVIHYNMLRRVGSAPSYVRSGIRVHEPWRDVTTFVREVEAEIGPRPNKSYSLDRINNDAGYVPGNIRWANAKTQANNRGHKQWLHAEDTPCLLGSRDHVSSTRPCDDCPLDRWLRG